MRDLCVSARLPLRAARGNTTEIKASNGWEKTSEATAQRRQRRGKECKGKCQTFSAHRPHTDDSASRI